MTNDKVKPVRRIVTVDRGNGTSTAIQDGPSPDVRTDPARPGFSSTRIWVTDRTPARIKGVRESLDMAHTLEPPRQGSVCRIVSFPPEDTYIRKIGAKEVRDYFEDMGSPGASTGHSGSPHAYMQKTRTLDFCLILEGDITLILDTEEVELHKGDTVVQRGTNHAWSNRGRIPCVIAFSSHDAFF